MNDKTQHIAEYRKEHHLYVIKPNDARKIPSLLDIVQHIFIDSLSLPC